MGVHAAGLDHRLYVLLAVFTHAAVGYALAALLTEGRPATGVAGAVLPDVDLLFAPAWSFPLVHRGVTHTPLFGALVVALAFGLAPRRRAVPGVAIGLLSHLLLDTLTASGVMWLYPLSTSSYAVDASVHAAGPQAVVWALLLGALLLYRHREAG